MAYSIKFPGKYIQGVGELENIGRVVKKIDSKFLLICSANNRKRVGNIIMRGL